MTRYTELLTTFDEPAAKRTPRHIIRCDHTCPGGNPCACNARHSHVYHICSEADCVCHQRQSYERQK